MSKPILKWAGGKRRLVPVIRTWMPQKVQSYYEPFAGGAALLFVLRSRGLARKAVLSDTNDELMNVYHCVRDRTDSLIRRLRGHQNNHSKEYYYDLRNQHNLTGSVERAARMMYLNKTCFNGLWRVNKKGEFNVPIGSYKNPNILNVADIQEASRLLQGVELHTRSFLITAPDKGSFVYCDPPYHKTFTSYTAHSFSERDQEQLHQQAVEWSDKGAYVMISNSNTPFIRELYKDFEIHEVVNSRSVSRKGSSRGSVKELLIMNYVAR